MSDNTDLEGNKIILQVRDKQREMIYTCRKNSKLENLMHRFWQLEGTHGTAIKFKFNGKTINKTDTPASLGMIDGDVIEAHIIPAQ